MTWPYNLLIRVFHSGTSYAQVYKSSRAWQTGRGRTFASSQVQGSITIGVLHIYVSIGCQQKLHHPFKAAASCIVQSRCTVLCLHISMKPLQICIVLSAAVDQYQPCKDRITNTFGRINQMRA